MPILRKEMVQELISNSTVVENHVSTSLLKADNGNCKSPYKYGKQATNIQIGSLVIPFSPTKTSEKCSVPSNPDVHPIKTSKLHPTSEDSDAFETIPMNELVAPFLCTVEDADVTCISDEEEEQQPNYESAEESAFTPSDMQSEDGDTSDDLEETDEKPEAEDQIVTTFLPPNYSYHITHFKSLSTHSFLGA